jgi:hypothetical protein
MKNYKLILTLLAFEAANQAFCQAIRVTSNEDCKFCIDRGWTHFCANATRNPNEPYQGFCCENYFSSSQIAYCRGDSRMACSFEISNSFKYAICP